MLRRFWWFSLLAALGYASLVTAQTSPQTALSPPQAWTWEQVKDRFELNNPTLLADKLNIDESKAQEITAFLRPNPDFTLSVDGTQIAPNNCVWRPFAGTYETPDISYLHERRHKRELRLESTRKATLLPSQAMPTWKEPCSSTCAAPLCQPCRRKRYCILPRTTLTTTTAC